MNTCEEYAKNKNFTDCPLTWNKHICLQNLEINMGVNQRTQYFDPSFEVCTCKLNFSENHFKTSEKAGQMYGKTFWMSFVLFVFAMNLFNLVWIPLLGMTFAVLGEKRNDFGKQTLWGSIGAITTSMISAITMNKYGSPTNEITFTPCFIGFGICTILTGTSTMSFKLEKIPNNPSMIKDILKLLKQPQSLLSFNNIFHHGISSCCTRDVPFRVPKRTECFLLGTWRLPSYEISWEKSQHFTSREP